MKIEKVKKIKNLQTILKDENVSKSQKIKHLFESGESISNIAKIMNIRYNFAYNVISNYVNMENIAIIRENSESKKDLIISKHLEGLTNKEISIDLKTNYNYVHSVLSKYKESIKDSK